MQSIVYSVKNTSLWACGPISPSLAHEEIHLWRIILPITDKAKLEFTESLSSDELFRLKNFHFKSDKERTLVSRGGLRNILARYLNMVPKDIQISYTKFGKPYLPQFKLYFSVSHSADCILYAISKCIHIGIDVEQYNNNINFLSIAKQFFSESEYSKFLNLSPQEKPLVFYRSWTRKEAILKATGKGLYFPLEQIKENLWELIEINPGEGYIAAIATKKSHKIYPWDLIK